MLPAHDSAHGSARCTTENLGDQQQKLGIIKLTYFLFADASPCQGEASGVNHHFDNECCIRIFDHFFAESSEMQNV